MQNLITDRTASDVERVNELMAKAWQDMTEAERAEWLAPMKGAYNYTDLNRVGVALNYVRDRLVDTLYLYEGAFEAVVDWGGESIPTDEDLKYYLYCVSICREALTQYETTPQTPAYSGSLDYIEANNIEKILLDVDELITKMSAAWFYSADLYAGEV